MTTEAPTPLLSVRQINLIVGGLMVGMFLAALDQMIVATAIRTIGDDLHGLTLQAWVTTAYLVAATISTPLYGKLSDIFGRKPLYVFSISSFVVGSLLSGSATSMYELAAFRAVQGLGAGGLMALALIILGDMLSPRERTKYQAFFFGVWGVASVLGPVLGGFFADAHSILGFAGWRWIFFLNVPLGVATLFIIVRVLHLPATHKRVQIDWAGVTALVVAIVPMLIVVEQGRAWGWTSGAVLGLGALTIVGILGFLLAEHRAGDNALLPPRLFKNRTVAVSTGLNFIMGFAMFGGMAGLPLYTQIAKGMSPTASGLTMLPVTFGIITMAGISARVIHQTGRYKMFPVIGTILLILGGLDLSMLHADSPLWHLFIGGALFGLGLGGVMQPNMLAVQNAVEPRDMGTGSASVMFFRQIGGSLGTAVFLSIMFGTVAGDIGNQYATAAKTPQFQQTLADPAVTSNPDNAKILALLNAGSVDQAAKAGVSLNDTSFIKTTNPVLAAPFQEGFSLSITRVLFISALIAIGGLLFALLVPHVPLREKSGLETMRDDEAEEPVPAVAMEM
ncbi:MDR family MFS transporter [Demequina lutea]|uniref:EmrB/QacA subfamily drug resistance transporter n=1 Tax=Demequina lutea TaxID=431489 RepID=A0A7Y9ZCC5_9MICO|nr:MDR family MFS transporter [Demequina lutea]NYI42784.1 EmrB/QacA subfamily drug resistance transporter [Demequina lutea]